MVNNNSQLVPFSAVSANSALPQADKRAQQFSAETENLGKLFYQQEFNPSIKPAIYIFQPELYAKILKQVVHVDPAKFLLTGGGLDLSQIKISIDPNLLNKIVTKTDETKKLDVVTDVIIARPFKELFSHIRHLKLPSLELLVRCIKTLVLAIFRGHFCDQLLLKIDGKIVSNLEGRVTTKEVEDFEKVHPFMLEHAYVLSLKAKALSSDEKVDISAYKTISPDTVRKYYNTVYHIQISDKAKGNTISDLFKSNSFTLKAAAA